MSSSAPASRRLPRQPMPKRVGSSDVKMISSIDRRGWKPAALQRADRLEPAEHADGAVVARRHWESRRCASRWRRPAAPARCPPSARTCCRRRPRARRGRRRAHRRLEIGARAQIGVGEDHARDGGRRARRRSPRASSSSARQSLPSSTSEPAVIAADADPSPCRSGTSPASCRARRTTAGSTAPSR